MLNQQYLELWHSVSGPLSMWREPLLECCPAYTIAEVGLGMRLPPVRWSSSMSHTVYCATGCGLSHVWCNMLGIPLLLSWQWTGWAVWEMTMTPTAPTRETTTYSYNRLPTTCCSNTLNRGRMVLETTYTDLRAFSTILFLSIQATLLLPLLE